MSVETYNTEYKKVISKQLVKNNILTKKTLLKTIMSCDDKKELENILKTAHLDENMKEDVEVSKLVEDDKEFTELLAEDMKLLTTLKKAIEEKIKALSEAEKQAQSKDDKRDEKEPTEEREEEIEEEGEEPEQEEDDEGRDEQEEKDNIDVKDLFSKVAFGITTERGDIFARIMKSQMRQIIVDINATRDTLHRTPSPEVLEYLEQNKQVFKAEIGVGVIVQTLSGRDREMFILAAMMMKEANSLVKTIDMYQEQYKAKMQSQAAETSKSEEDVEKSGGKTNRKYWELSPEEQADIQRKQSETGRNFDPNDTRDNQVRGEASIQNAAGR